LGISDPLLEKGSGGAPSFKKKSVVWFLRPRRRNFFQRANAERASDEDNGRGVCGREKKKKEKREIENQENQWGVSRAEQEVAAKAWRFPIAPQ